jgi:hypothetical protein
MPSRGVLGFASTAFTRAKQARKFVDDAEKIKQMYDRGDIKGLLKAFKVPEFIQRKNIQLFPTTFFDNDQEKETCSLEERELVTAALKTAAGYAAAFGQEEVQGETTTTPSGGSLFKRYQLPPGSKLSSTISLGRRAFPPNSVAQPAKATIFKSEFKAGTGDLVKGEAFRAKTVGFNRVLNVLVPLQMPELGMRRMSIMQNWNYASSHAPTDSELQAAYDTPSKDGFDKDDSTLISGGIGRKTYVPNNQYASYSVTNLNKLLNMSIKLSLVQLKGIRGMYLNNSNIINLRYINPITALGTVLEAMPANNKVDSAFTAHSGVANTNHKIWGFGAEECEEFIGAYTAETVTPYTLQSSPTFEDNFHVIKSLNFNIGPGSTRELNLNRFGSTCYQNMGDFNQVTPSSSQLDHRMNFSPRERIFVLVEIKGAPNQSYYRYLNITGQTEKDKRTWSVAKSAPVQFSHKLDMHVELPLKQDINTVSYDASAGKLGGVVYKKNYMKITNETNVSATVHQPYDNIYPDETAIAAGTDGYIFPIATNLEMSSSQVRAKD